MLSFDAGLADEASGSLTAEFPEAAQEALDDRDWEALVAELSKPGPWNKDADALHWRGHALLALGKHEPAEKALVASWKIKPGNPNTALLLCRAAAVTGNHRWAAEMCRQFPMDSELHYLAGMANLKTFLTYKNAHGTLFARILKETRQGMDYHFDAALRLGCNHSGLHRALAFKYNRSGEHELAVKHARRAIELSPCGAEVHMLLASSLMQSGDYDEALIVFDHAYRLAPGKRAYFESERGQALFKSGRYNEATDAYLAALKADKYHNSARYWVGRCAYEAGNYRLAIWGFGESAVVDSNVSAHYWLGRCAYDLENDALAEHHIRNAMTKGKDSHYSKGKPPAAWSHYLGRALWGQGKKDQALKQLRSALDADKGNMLYARWLFRCYLQNDDPHGALKVCEIVGTNGNFDDAIEGMNVVMKKWPMPRLQDRAAGKPPHMVVGYLVRAKICYHHRRYHEAAKCYERLRMHQGKFARTQAGWSYAYTGQLDAAEKCFTDYIANQKPEKHFYGHYGLTYVNALRRDVAKTKAHAGKMKDGKARQSALLWCARRQKDAEAAAGLSDPYTELGIFSYNTRKRGLRIGSLFPDSPLANAKPALRRGDIVRKVGEHYLGSKEQMEELRSSKMPEGPVEVIVWRGNTTFIVTIEYPHQPVVSPTPPPAP